MLDKIALRILQGILCLWILFGIVVIWTSFGYHIMYGELWEIIVMGVASFGVFPALSYLKELIL